MRKFFNPEVFLEVARLIKDRDDLHEEGKFRTSIGRAYYAAFLTLREHLAKHYLTKFDKEGQHQKVLDTLDELGENYLKSLLDTLRDNRVKVDYFLYSLIDRQLCENCLNLSKQIIDSVEGI